MAADRRGDAGGSAAGENGARILVKENGVQVGQPVTVQNGTWSIDLPASIGMGTHDLTIEQSIGGTPSGTTTAPSVTGTQSANQWVEQVTAVATAGGALTYAISPSVNVSQVAFVTGRRAMRKGATSTAWRGRSLS